MYKSQIYIYMYIFICMYTDIYMSVWCVCRGAGGKQLHEARESRCAQVGSLTAAKLCTLNVLSNIPFIHSYLFIYTYIYIYIYIGGWGGLVQLGNRFVSFVLARAAVCKVRIDLKEHSMPFSFPLFS